MTRISQGGRAISTGAGISIIGIACLVGCGGSGGDGDTTSISGRVIGADMAGATVCLDTSNDFSCDDEARDLVGTVGTSGEFSLPPLRSELLAARALVVEAPDTNAARTAAPTERRRLLALASLATDGDVYVSPLASLAWRMGAPYVHSETGWSWHALIHKYCYGDMRDSFDNSKFQIRLEKHNWNCAGGEHHYSARRQDKFGQYP